MFALLCCDDVNSQYTNSYGPRIIVMTNNFNSLCNHLIKCIAEEVHKIYIDGIFLSKEYLKKHYVECLNKLIEEMRTHGSIADSTNKVIMNENYDVTIDRYESGLCYYSITKVDIPEITEDIAEDIAEEETDDENEDDEEETEDIAEEENDGDDEDDEEETEDEKENDEDDDEPHKKIQLQK